MSSAHANAATVAAMETLLREFESLTIDCGDDNIVDEGDEYGSIPTTDVSQDSLTFEVLGAGTPRWLPVPKTELQAAILRYLTENVLTSYEAMQSLTRKQVYTLLATVFGFSRKDRANKEFVKLVIAAKVDEYTGETRPHIHVQRGDAQAAIASMAFLKNGFGNN